MEVGGLEVLILTNYLDEGQVICRLLDLIKKQERNNLNLFANNGSYDMILL